MFPSPVEQDSSVVDIDAIQVVCEKFNVDEAEVHKALLNGDPHDQLAIAYHLIIDNKRIADEAAKAELKDFYVASSPPPVAISPNESTSSPMRPHPERIARKCSFSLMLHKYKNYLNPKFIIYILLIGLIIYFSI